eukprot:4366935-Prymnesium_polylepis.1
MARALPKMARALPKMARALPKMHVPSLIWHVPSLIWHGLPLSVASPLSPTWQIYRSSDGGNLADAKLRQEIVEA